jgi:hypothetical protein
MFPIGSSGNIVRNRIPSGNFRAGTSLLPIISRGTQWNHINGNYLQDKWLPVEIRAMELVSSESPGYNCYK